jgi:SulP family sulfate permease
MRGYQRAWIATDLLAGMTLLVIAVPEQLATSRLAGMPPATALWAFVAATVVFFLLGSSRIVSVGADSTIAPLFAAAVTRLSVAGSPHAFALTSLSALLTGGIILVVGGLRLGWIADFLSIPIITGFMVGVAFTIVVHQLPDLLGAGSASGSAVHRISEISRHLGSTNGWSVGIGLVVFAVMIVSEKIDRRVPAALIGLVGSTILVATAGLEQHGVSVLGRVTTGLPHVGVPGVTPKDVVSILPVSISVALICLAQTAATVRSFSANEDPPMLDRDFVALGAGNILAGFAGTFPVDASPARTAVVNGARGHTQLACLFAAVVIAVASPAANELHLVPLATLAAILIFVATRLVKVTDLRSIARFSRIELGLAIVTAVVVAFVGVEQGIAVAILLAALDRASVSARPRLIELGRVPGTTSWAPMKAKDPSEQVPGVRVVMFAGPLYFANAGVFRARLKQVIQQPGRPKALVLDAAGMINIDYTGATILRSVVDILDQEKIELALARLDPGVMNSLQESGILDRLGTNRVFDTVDQAVEAVTQKL